MTIVHIVEPFATGINTFIHELVFGLPEHEHIIVHGEREENRSLEEIKQEYLGKATFIKWHTAQRKIDLAKDIKAYKELSRILQDLEFDVLHLHSSKSGVLGRIYALFNQHKNVVYTPNGASFLRTDISNAQKWFFKKIEKVFSHFPGKIVSSSKSEADAFAEACMSTRTIKNGVQINLNASERKSEKTINVVSCGKITTQKNPALFNNLADHFSNHPNIQFSWIGDGELNEALHSNVNVLGWQNKTDVIKHLNHADIYLSTSLWEGLPLAVIEAMGCGLPLILNNCPGNKDLVIQGKNGFLFNTLDEAVEQISSLSENKALRATFSEKSRQMYLDQFQGFRCAKAYNKIYQSILAQNTKANLNKALANG